MSSATKPDKSLRAQLRPEQRPVGSLRLRLRRQTPLTPVAKADLDLCRMSHNAPAGASLPSRVIVPTLADHAQKSRASIRSAYRPKPESGGAYSVIGSTEEEAITRAEPSSRVRRSTQR